MSILEPYRVRDRGLELDTLRALLDRFGASRTDSAPDDS